MKLCRKIFLILVMFCLTANLLTAQSVIPAMLKQIALIETYIGYIQKGYSIARKGLNTIGDIKNGHWQLDIDFFNSLKNVNPQIRKYAKVEAIIEQQHFIIKVCHRLRGFEFNNDERSYITKVTDHLLDECRTMTDQLVSVITDKKLQMSDDERIHAIDVIYEVVKDQYSFIKDFSDRAALLIGAREKESKDIKFSRSIRGI